MDKGIERGTEADLRKNNECNERNERHMKNTSSNTNLRSFMERWKKRHTSSNNNHVWMEHLPRIKKNIE